MIAIARGQRRPTEYRSRVTRRSPHDQSTPQGGPSFEEALAQVESIIERIESGQIGLEASVGEYERGAALLQRCRDILDRAQQRVDTLQKRAAAPAPLPPSDTD